MTESDNYDEEFREIFLGHLKIVRNMDNSELARINRAENRLKIRQMIQDNKVSRMTVIASIIEGLKLYPEKVDYIFGKFFLPKFIAKSEDERLIDAYPELLWLLHASGHLSRRETVSAMFDLAQDLIEFIGHKLTRSYLNYLLLTCPNDEAITIIPAYYYSGHDVESLRLVITLLPKVPSLTGTIYTDAMVFVLRLNGEKLPQKDLVFLTEFLSTGLTYNNPIIVGYCQQALEELKKSGDSEKELRNEILNKNPHHVDEGWNIRYHHSKGFSLASVGA